TDRRFESSWARLGTSTAALYSFTDRLVRQAPESILGALFEDELDWLLQTQLGTSSVSPGPFAPGTSKLTAQ
ncbi:MAG: hypothetical protein ACOCU4_10860, partial [Alkalispirochaeta sp.]